MIKSKWILTGLVAILVVIAVGCGTAAQTTGSSQTSNTTGSTQTSNTTQTASTTTSTQGDAKVGQQLFQTNCSGCHNTTAVKKVGPGLQGIFKRDKLPNGQAVNDTDVTQWIKTGDTNMPGNPALSAADLANIVAYLKTL